jgi:hypothetical protein
MSADIPERDWKVFRQLRSLALERFCERVLSQVKDASSASDQSAHERYLKVFHIVREENKQLAGLFDDPRRSTAWQQLCLIRSADLLSDEEMLRFSPETQDSVSVFVAHLTNR